jgi:hypothetical protein
MISPAAAGVRNGLPETPPYQYRARTYPNARRLIAAAEAEHGQPVPVCRWCGGSAKFTSEHVKGWCPTCQRQP